MTKRDEYVRRLEAAIDELKVKRSLAKLEARDLRGELLTKFDALHDRLHDLKQETGERWEGLRDGVEAAWKEFRRAFHDATHRQAT